MSITRLLKSLAIFSLTYSLIIISGCATLSKGECLEADWYEIGAKDGASGKPSSRLNDHREACKKHGVFPDREQYYMGREEGIQIYCTPKNGFKQGYAGNYYSGSCPIDLEQGFLAGYRHGREIYDIKQKISANDRKLKNLEKELTKKETSQERRKEIREEIRHLDKSNNNLRDEVRDLEGRQYY
ncbi:MAG: DUF2799 domain-containing protein [Gammaproteobacteria bacterium]|nr:MAG: DUF2799 domain-containing protein [Gammaproteobacteria bacterium]